MRQAADSDLDGHAAMMRRARMGGNRDRLGMHAAAAHTAAA